MEKAEEEIRETKESMQNEVENAMRALETDYAITYCEHGQPNSVQCLRGNCKPKPASQKGFWETVCNWFYPSH